MQGKRWRLLGTSEAEGAFCEVSMGDPCAMPPNLVPWISLCPTAHLLSLNPAKDHGREAAHCSRAGSWHLRQEGGQGIPSLPPSPAVADLLFHGGEEAG